jgi:hypothetical protein
LIDLSGAMDEGDINGTEFVDLGVSFQEEKKPIAMRAQLFLMIQMTKYVFPSKLLMRIPI